MTATQQARIAGFRASLSQRGHSLTVNGTTSAFLALVEPVGVAEAGQFAVARETANTAHVHVLRDDLPAVPVVGDILHCAESAARYRIAEIENQPANPVVVFRDCEVTVVE